jgi:hypothetical protein
MALSPLTILSGGDDAQFAVSENRAFSWIPSHEGFAADSTHLFKGRSIRLDLYNVGGFYSGFQALELLPLTINHKPGWTQPSKMRISTVTRDRLSWK